MGKTEYKPRISYIIKKILGSMFVLSVVAFIMIDFRFLVVWVIGIILSAMIINQLIKKITLKIIVNDEGVGAKRHGLYLFNYPDIFIKRVFYRYNKDFFRFMCQDPDGSGMRIDKAILYKYPDDGSKRLVIGNYLYGWGCFIDMVYESMENLGWDLIIDDKSRFLGTSIEGKYFQNPKAPFKLY